MSELKRKALRGAVWNTIQSLSNKGISFLFLILISRLLQPDDYGMIGMLAIFIVLSDAFIDCGFGQALIRKQNRTILDESTVFYFNIVASIACYLCLFFISPLVALFYNMPELGILLRVLGLKLTISALATIQMLRCSIDLDFKTPAIVNVLSNMLSGSIALYMAYNGYGVWALVFQQVGRSLFTTLLFFVLCRWTPIWGFSWSTFREMFSFGSKLLGQRLLNAFYANVSTIFIGKAYSATDLGLYSKANELDGYPSGTIYGVINTVSYPLLCKCQEDRSKLTSIYGKLLRVLAFGVCPLMTFIFFFAKPIIVTVMGEQWIGAGIYLMLLTYPHMFVPFVCVNQNLLQVTGRTDLILRLEVISKIIGVIMLAISLPIGIDVMCYCGIITGILCFFLNTAYTTRYIDLTLIQQSKEILKPLCLSVGLCLAISLALMTIESYMAKLLIAMTLFASSYLIISFATKFQPLLDCIDLIKNRK